MRAVTYSAFSDDNSTLEVREVDPPKVAASAVLIKVHAASVNPVDWKLLAGALDAMMDTIFPAIPGWDVAGTVLAVGPDTPEFAPGDEVLAYARKEVNHGGTFAEQVAVPAVAVARKPAGLPWEQAAGLPLAGGTALRSLDRVQLTEGQTVLIHGAAGGVGSLGVQLAVARGARVIGTASPRNHDFLAGLGAEPVAYGEGLADRVRALAPDGVDAVADFVGGQLEATLAVLRPGGRHVSIVDPAVQEHGGSIVWVRPDGAETARLAELAAAGKLRVEIAGTFGLDRVGEAFDLSRAGHTRGKLIIVP
ncbi:MAG TPA: NADP-dependent oxidoreductase [Microlunatus sp.]|nr:NADP-dependent oxidoreductase [Microlunatus sp.]